MTTRAASDGTARRRRSIGGSPCRGQESALSRSCSTFSVPSCDGRFVLAIEHSRPEDDWRPEKWLGWDWTDGTSEVPTTRATDVATAPTCFADLHFERTFGPRETDTGSALMAQFDYDGPGCVLRRAPRVVAGVGDLRSVHWRTDGKAGWAPLLVQEGDVVQLLILTASSRCATNRGRGAPATRPRRERRPPLPLARADMRRGDLGAARCRGACRQQRVVRLGPARPAVGAGLLRTARLAAEPGNLRVACLVFMGMDTSGRMVTRGLVQA